MKRVVDFLKKSQTQYLATMGTDGKPKVRPFQFKLEDGGKLYFSTTNDKQVYKEITQHSYVELCACGENWSWLRLSLEQKWCMGRARLRTIRLPRAVWPGYIPFGSSTRTLRITTILRGRIISTATLEI